MYVCWAAVLLVFTCSVFHQYHTPVALVMVAGLNADASYLTTHLLYLPLLEHVVVALEHHRRPGTGTGSGCLISPGTGTGSGRHGLLSRALSRRGRSSSLVTVPSFSLTFAPLARRSPPLLQVPGDQQVLGGEGRAVGVDAQFPMVHLVLAGPLLSGATALCILSACVAVATQRPLGGRAAP